LKHDDLDLTLSGIYHVPAHEVKVFDVTGAGDTVVAMIAYCLNRYGFSEENLKNACYIANLEASFVVSQHGTATIEHTEKEIDWIWSNIQVQDQVYN